MRLPFGIKSANDLFQQKRDKCLESLSGVKTIVDDIVDFGKDQATHDKNLDLLMTRCRKTGIRLNPDKTEIGKNEIPFFGHVLTLTGQKMDPAKVKAVMSKGQIIRKTRILDTTMYCCLLSNNSLGIHIVHGYIDSNMIYIVYSIHYIPSPIQTKSTFPTMFPFGIKLCYEIDFIFSFFNHKENE